MKTNTRSPFVIPCLQVLVVLNGILIAHGPSDRAWLYVISGVALDWTLDELERRQEAEK